jgi:membrane protease YdiL (CAAX protease family)
MVSSRARLLILASGAALLFVPLFAFRHIGAFDFWWWMSFNIAALILLSFALERPFAQILLADFHSGLGRKIVWGILSAVFLYGIFYAGNLLSRQFLPFAPEGISRVYGFKEGASLLRIILLIVFLIGPGEEVFWRATIQRQFQSHVGDLSGWLISAAIYALVHLGSGNLMLVMAAGVCGLFWGWLYLRYRSIVMVAVSHTLWDILAFIVVPFSF